MDRRLAAIVAADVVGFSRLAGSAEEDTLRRLDALWSDVSARISDAGGECSPARATG